MERGLEARSEPQAVGFWGHWSPDWPASQFSHPWRRKTWPGVIPGMWPKTTHWQLFTFIFFILKTGGDIQLRKIPRDLSWLILWKMSGAAKWFFRGSFTAGWVNESKISLKGPSCFPGAVFVTVLFPGSGAPAQLLSWAQGAIAALGCLKPYNVRAHWSFIELQAKINFRKGSLYSKKNEVTRLDILCQALWGDFYLFLLLLEIKTHVLFQGRQGTGESDQKLNKHKVMQIDLMWKLRYVETMPLASVTP